MGARGCECEQSKSPVTRAVLLGGLLFCLAGLGWDSITVVKDWFKSKSGKDKKEKKEKKDDKSDKSDAEGKSSEDGEKKRKKEKKDTKTDKESKADDDTSKPDETVENAKD